jgi:hypothetical protein
MSLAAVVNNVTFDQSRIYVTGLLTASGSYSTGGDTLNINTATWPPGSLGAVPSQQRCDPAQSFVQGGFGYSFDVIPGTSPANSLVKISTASGSNELPAGAYPSQITGDTNMTFCLAFPKLV